MHEQFIFVVYIIIALIYVILVEYFFAIDSLGQIGRVAFLAELGENLGRDGLKYWPS